MAVITTTATSPIAIYIFLLEILAGGGSGGGGGGGSSEIIDFFTKHVYIHLIRLSIITDTLILKKLMLKTMKIGLGRWWARPDLNRRPTGYEPAALT